MTPTLEQRDYTQRAIKIVDRVMPRLLTAHRMDPANWIKVSRHDSARKRLFWRTFARLRAKAEGGVPYLAIPKGCEHLWGPGDAMFDVARELADAVPAELLPEGERVVAEQVAA